MVGRFGFRGGLFCKICLFVKSRFCSFLSDIFVFIVVVMSVGNMKRGKCSIVKSERDVKVLVGVNVFLNRV